MSNIPGAIRMSKRLQGNKNKQNYIDAPVTGDFKDTE